MCGNLAFTELDRQYGRTHFASDGLCTLCDVRQTRQTGKKCPVSREIRSSASGCGLRGIDNHLTPFTSGRSHFLTMCPSGPSVCTIPAHMQYVYIMTVREAVYVTTRQRNTPTCEDALSNTS